MYKSFFRIFLFSLVILLASFFVVKAQSLTSIDFVPSGSITGLQYSGNSATASALLTLGTTCPGGSFATGIDRTGNAICEINSGGSFSFDALTTSYLPKWDGTSFINSLIYDNGTNIGIGTTNPITKLHVTGGGNAIVRNDTMSFDNDYDLINKGYLDAVLPDGPSTGFWDGSLIGDVYNANSGNIGIGTTNPTSLLTLNKTSGATGFLLQGNGTDVAMFRIASAGVNHQLQFGTISNNEIAFYTANSEKMRLSNTGGLVLGNAYVGTDPGAGSAIISGNVGIGIVSPLTKLHIVGGGSAIARNDTMSFDNDYDLINKGYLVSALEGITTGTVTNTTGTYGYWNLSSSGAISNRTDISNSIGINTYGVTGLDNVSFAIAQGSSGGATSLVYVSSADLSAILGYSNTNFNNTFKIGDTIKPNGQATTTITWISTTTEKMLVTPAYASSFSATTYDLTSIPEGGAPRFVVKGSGAVGINIMDPQASLHISSSATNASSTDAILVSDASSVPSFKVDRDGKVSIGSSSSDQLLNIGGGKIYLGSTSSSSEVSSMLYNVEGDLYWGENIIASASSNPWNLIETNIYASSSEWNVAIGLEDPGEYKLSVLGNTLLNGDVSIGGKLSSYLTENLWLSAGGTRRDLDIDNGSGRVAIGTTANISTIKLNVSGSETHALYLNGGILGGLAEPLSSDDAATKFYVDDKLGAAALPLIGGTMEGAIDMGAYNITNINEITANKLNVNVIDPLYTIDNINYATFGASFAGGLKEEYTGKLKIEEKNITGEYEYIINFDKMTSGSDLWLWRQVIDFSKDNVEVIVTPYGNFAEFYYLIEDNNIIFRSKSKTEISFRLTARRFDWKKWPTLVLDQQKKGMIIR